MPPPASPVHPRLAGALVLLLAAVLLAGTACGRDRSRYLTATAERADLEATVSATGTLNPVRMIEVGTQTSGRIESIDVDFNSRVTKGQRVAKIDPANALVRVQKAQAGLQTARAQVERAQADLELKSEQLRRQKALHGQAVASDDRLDNAETVHRQARAQLAVDRAALERAEAELRDAEVNLGYTDIVSPVDGIVLKRSVNVGQTVAASFQTPTLFLIAENLTQMQVNADVSESDIGLVEAGQLARFRVDAYPERVFEGTVREVRNSPLSVQNVVTYDVVIDVSNEDLALRPGMTATVSLATASKEDVLTVPLRALRFRPDDLAVPRVAKGRALLWVPGENGRPESREVELGMRDDRAIEVRGGGVEAGDDVIVGYRRGL